MGKFPTYSSFKKDMIKAQTFRAVRHIPVIGEELKRKKYGDKSILSTEEGRRLLKQAIVAGKPYMAARFGTSEGAAFVYYWETKLKYGDDCTKYPQFYLDQICTLSGFFPNSKAGLWKWAELETAACKDLDLLGVMQFVNEEWLAKHFCSQASLMPSGGLGSASRGWNQIR